MGNKKIAVLLDSMSEGSPHLMMPSSYCYNVWLIFILANTTDW